MNMAEETVVTLTAQDLLDFQRLVNTINGKRVNYALRTVLRYSFELCPKLVDASSGVALYKLFEALMILEGPFTRKGLDRKEHWETYYGQGRNDLMSISGNSIEVLISVFEVALFNKDVLSAVKSSTLMEQRQAIFTFLNNNSQFLHAKIQEQTQLAHNENADPSLQALNHRLRLVYASMYFAFEIKNDMMQSVNLYQQLQAFVSSLPGGKVSVRLPWVSRDYFLDNARMTEFGDFKIQQAKIFKDFDSGLLKLKQKEHRLIEESRKPAKSRSENEKIPALQAHEFDKYATFYLDQFFLYLNASVSV